MINMIIKMVIGIDGEYIGLKILFLEGIISDIVYKNCQIEFLQYLKQHKYSILSEIKDIINQNALEYN
jgi:hypothetical protein